MGGGGWGGRRWAWETCLPAQLQEEESAGESTLFCAGGVGVTGVGGGWRTKRPSPGKLRLTATACLACFPTHFCAFCSSSLGRRRKNEKRISNKRKKRAKLCLAALQLS